MATTRERVLGSGPLVEMSHRGELSVWFKPNTAPGSVGAYNASCFRTPIMMRWWDGVNWSQSWVYGSTPNFAIASAADQELVWWRGLLSQPKE